MSLNNWQGRHTRRPCSVPAILFDITHQKAMVPFSLYGLFPTSDYLAGFLVDFLADFAGVFFSGSSVGGTSTIAALPEGALNPAAAT